MATMNPLEQKARSSFFKGFILALLFGLVGSGALGFLYYKQIETEKKRVDAQKDVIVLTRKAESGQEITSDMVKKTKIDGALYSNSMPSSFDQLVNNFVSSEDGEDAASNIKLIAKTEISENSVLTKHLVAPQDAMPTNDLRKEQYNMIVLPSNLENEQTIDVRLRLPSGQDYIVLSKKKVEIPQASGESSSSTIELNVTEEEILTMSAAIVDAYKIAGSKLYAVKYTEPGLQEKAEATYIPSTATLQIIQEDPNIIKDARNGILLRYQSKGEVYRTNGVDNALRNIDADEQKTAVESGTSTEITTQRTEREKYLQDLE